MYLFKEEDVAKRRATSCLVCQADNDKYKLTNVIALPFQIFYCGERRDVDAITGRIGNSAANKENSVKYGTAK